MPDIAAIEVINREQLVTATDRLLLRGRVSKHRPSARSLSSGARGSSPQLPPAPLAGGSQPRIALAARRTAHPAPPRRASRPVPVLAPRHERYERPERHERTMPAHRRAAVVPQICAAVIAVPTLVGIAVGLAALL